MKTSMMLCCESCLYNHFSNHLSLTPCQVLSFYIHEFMFEVKDSKGQESSVFPRDNDIQFIPEFTMIDLRIMTSHNAVEGGYGCKLQQITLHPTSLYSYLGPESLFLIPHSLQSSLELAD
jgi:hypothetical protein